jgi:hypothetical protein
MVILITLLFPKDVVITSDVIAIVVTKIVSFLVIPYNSLLD